MTPDQVLRNTYGITLRTLVTRITKTFDKATPADLEAGAEWYPLASELAADLALQSGRSKACCAAVIAHLSPRMKWERNVLAAHMFLVDKKALEGTMERSLEAAQRALDAEGRQERMEPTFSRKAKKTSRFFRNIMGDHTVVTVDVWALRAARLDDEFIDRAGVYEAIEYAYQLAARRKGVTPATFQATCWVVARGGRAA